MKEVIYCKSCKSIGNESYGFLGKRCRRCKRWGNTAFLCEQCDVLFHSDRRADDHWNEHAEQKYLTDLQNGVPTITAVIERERSMGKGW